jgi:arginine deiminase
MTILLIQSSPAISFGQSASPGAAAEWLPAREVLVHTPGEELFYGVIHPAAALFERSFSSAEAISEHQQWRTVLERNGLKVHNLRDLLLAGTTDLQTGALIEGVPLQRLRKLGRQAIDIQLEGFSTPQEELAAQQAYLDQTLSQLDAGDLWRLVILRPIVRLKSTGGLNTGYTATYEVRPVMNLYFCRDQMITTSRGIVLGLMNSEQRRLETDIMSAALDALDYQPLYRIQEPGRLEGGDFLPAGERVFLGQGLRTNSEAVDQLLKHDVFGTEEVVIVKDSWQNQDQMHLDTFFNLAGPRTALMVETRLSVDTRNQPRQRDPHMTLKADVYKRKDNGSYERAQADIDFENYLRDQLRFTIIPVSAEDQLRYGVNVLTVSENRVIGVNGVSDSLKSNLEQAGVESTWIDFSALTGGYGACHCTTQVLRRGK